MENQLPIEIEVLTAVNNSKKYLDCLEYFVMFWKCMNQYSPEIQFRPQVIYVKGVGESDPRFSVAVQEFVQIFETNLPTTFVAQNIRNYAPCFSQADFVTATDIDMFPLSPKLFTAALSHLSGNDDLFVVARNVLGNSEIPICYNIARPSTWKKVINPEKKQTAEEFLSELFACYVNAEDYRGERGKKYWNIDQVFLSEKVKSFETTNGNVLWLRDKDTGHRRLDRGLHPFPINWMVGYGVLFDLFTDYHVHHPVIRHSKFINFLLKRLECSIKQKQK